MTKNELYLQLEDSLFSEENKQEIVNSVLLLQPLLVDGQLEEDLEVNWLESTNEWVVNHEYTVLVDNLHNEKSAQTIMYAIENLLYS